MIGKSAPSVHAFLLFNDLDLGSVAVSFFFFDGALVLLEAPNFPSRNLKTNHYVSEDNQTSNRTIRKELKALTPNLVSFPYYR